MYCVGHQLRVGGLDKNNKLGAVFWRVRSQQFCVWRRSPEGRGVPVLERQGEQRYPGGQLPALRPSHGNKRLELPKKNGRHPEVLNSGLVYI